MLEQEIVAELHARIASALTAEVLSRTDLETEALAVAIGVCVEQLVERGVEPWAVVRLLRSVANSVALNAVPPAGSA